MPTQIGNIQTAEAQVRVKNRGTSTVDRTVSLMRGGVEKDTTTVSLAPGEEVVVTMADGDFGEADVGTIFNYKADTGDRNPTFETEIIGLLVIGATDQAAVPSYDVSKIEWTAGGELHFNQTDALKLSQ